MWWIENPPMYSVTPSSSDAQPDGPAQYRAFLEWYLRCSSTLITDVFTHHILFLFPCSFFLMLMLYLTWYHTHSSLPLQTCLWRQDLQSHVFFCQPPGYGVLWYHFTSHCYVLIASVASLHSPHLRSCLIWKVPASNNLMIRKTSSSPAFQCLK